MCELIRFDYYNVALRKKLLSQYLFNINENQYRDIEINESIHFSKRLRIIKLILWCKFKGFENNLKIFNDRYKGKPFAEVPFSRMQYRGHTDGGLGVVLNFGYEKFTFNIYLNRLFMQRYFPAAQEIYKTHYILSFGEDLWI